MYRLSNSVSEQLLDLVLLVNDFPFKYDLVEVVILKLVDLDLVLLLEHLVELSTLRLVPLWEGDGVQLFDVLNVVDCEALLELFRKLLYVLPVAEGQDYSRDVVILAGCQLFSNATNGDHLTQGCDLSCHGKVWSHRLSCSARDQSCEEGSTS